ncbi:MAG: Fe-S cluster assembly protein SufB, partial [Cyanobacteria bacterium REEB65]|nr:Fe-S cluster assembly protein SufB [Cyanobacteria bacterium REEB65]
MSDRTTLQPSESQTLDALTSQDYRYGFVTEIEADAVPPGLDEDVVRRISAKKNEPEWLLQWRLKALRHWQTMPEPQWQNVHYPPIDYQAIVYYSAPKAKKQLQSMDEVDPELKRAFEKLGV